MTLAAPETHAVDDRSQRVASVVAHTVTVLSRQQSPRTPVFDTSSVALYDMMAAADAASIALDFATLDLMPVRPTEHEVVLRLTDMEDLARDARGRLEDRTVAGGVPRRSPPALHIAEDTELLGRVTSVSPQRVSVRGNVRGSERTVRVHVSEADARRAARAFADGLNIRVAGRIETRGATWILTNVRAFDLLD
jgi:hypothetical protein